MLVFVSGKGSPVHNSPKGFWLISQYFNHWTDTQENADRIAQAVTVEYDSLGPPLVTVEDAIKANSYVENVKPSEVRVGDAKSKPIAAV